MTPSPTSTSNVELGFTAVWKAILSRCRFVGNRFTGQFKRLPVTFTGIICSVLPFRTPFMSWYTCHVALACTRSRTISNTLAAVLRLLYCSSLKYNVESCLHTQYGIRAWDDWKSIFSRCRCKRLPVTTTVQYLLRLTISLTFHIMWIHAMVP